MNANTDEFATIMAEYPEDYCNYLEMVYGEGMMSEGGVEAIDAMFKDIQLENKTALDIGAGLGGVALHLAKHHNIKITGLEINPWMVEEANKRVPKELKNRVKFSMYSDINQLPFDDEYFDIVFSKGVLAHVKNKPALLKEIYRILKKEGHLIINDWLSSSDDDWGPKMKRMCEIDNLTIYPVTPKKYIQLIANAGFSKITSVNKSQNYLIYNRDIVSWLANKTNKKNFIKKFSEDAWQSAYEGYELISKAIDDKELLIYCFYAAKP